MASLWYWVQNFTIFERNALDLIFLYAIYGEKFVHLKNVKKKHVPLCEMNGLLIRIEQISRANHLFKTQSICLILLIYFHIQRSKRELNYSKNVCKNTCVLLTTSSVHRTFPVDILRKPKKNIKNPNDIIKIPNKRYIFTFILISVNKLTELERTSRFREWFF